MRAANECQREPSGPSIVSAGGYGTKQRVTDVTLQGQALRGMLSASISEVSIVLLLGVAM